MGLTEREWIVLKLSLQGLTDYRIARKINVDPPSVTRSRHNAYKKIEKAKADIERAKSNRIHL